MAGFWREVFLGTDTSVSTIVIDVPVYATSSTPGATGTVRVELDNVTFSSKPPTSGSPKMSVRNVEIAGSVRTPGSIQVGHATASLGDGTIVYSSPTVSEDGFAPDLRPYRTDASVVTADTDAVSGSRTVATTTDPAQVTVPATMLREGPYQLFARLRRSDNGGGDSVITSTAALKVGATLIGTQTQVTDTLPLLGPDGVNAGYRVVNLGGFVLPPAPTTAESSASVVIEFEPDFTSLHWDDLFLFYMGDDAALSVTDCGFGTPTLGSAHSHLFLDSATVSVPDRVYLGTLADRSDAFSAGSFTSWHGVHHVRPPATGLFVVTPGATYPEVGFRSYVYGHTHVPSAT